MAQLVCVDAHSGSLTRFEGVGRSKVRTHYAVPKDGPEALTARLVENFRTYPDPAFEIAPPPRPTNPPAAAGACRLPTAANYQEPIAIAA